MGEVESIKKQATAIEAYGNPILEKVSEDILKKDLFLEQLIENLWTTLELCDGVGLAAPQINRPFKVFVVKSTLLYHELDAENQQMLFHKDKGIEEVFINAKILSSSEETSSELEGCLSIPSISHEVERPWNIKVEYLDEKFMLRRKDFSGYTARVIQHEYDHTQGMVFIDHLSSLDKYRIRGKLRKIKKGRVQTNYPIHFLKS